MPARTGEQFLEGLKGDREIWVGGERVRDVVEHPALRGAAHAMASIFDLQHEAADVCLMPDPETGEPINVSHMIPRSKDDLYRRRACLQRTAEATVGLMGRTPDYMNVTFAGFAGRPDEWGMAGNEEGTQHLVAFQKELARKDISLTHTIIHPTIDKSQGDAPKAGNEVALHKVEDTEHGIRVRGARILATLAPFADEIAVYPAYPVPEGADDYALAFSIPMATPGLKFLCRDSVSREGSVFDHPLSSRFDEQDAFVIFEDVEVPRERVFIDANRAVYNQVMTTSWGGNITHQTMVRAQIKLVFAWGLATRMLEAIGAINLRNMEVLGEIWCYAELVRSAIRTAEEECVTWPSGSVFPAYGPLQAVRSTLPSWMPRVNEIFRLLGSHNLFAAPSERQLDAPELAPLLEKYLHGAGDMAARERARIFRLAWDFCGTALASRNEQYERFYLASGARNMMFSHMTADKELALRLVDRFLTEETS